MSVPSECGKTFLLKHSFLNIVQFDRLYIIGPTGNQYDDSKYRDIKFIKDIKKLVPQKVSLGRHKNCNMKRLHQNLFSLDRQGVRENCNIFVLFEKRGNVFHRIYNDFSKETEIDYKDFDHITTKVWEEPHNYLVFALSKNKNVNGKLRINWDRRILQFSKIYY